MQKVLLIHQRVEMVVMEEIQFFQQKLQRVEVEVVALIVVTQELLVVQVEGVVEALKPQEALEASVEEALPKGAEGMTLEMEAEERIRRLVPRGSMNWILAHKNTLTRWRKEEIK